jgi:hypothetical protein
VTKKISNSNMEESTDKKDCGCDAGCCPPKRKPKWTMILSALVILAALAIIAVKLLGGDGAAAAKDPSQSAASPASCDTTGKGGCDTTKNSSCCPK